MSRNSHDHPQPEATPDWLEVVRRNVESLRYGPIQISAGDGRVTQIESIERTRFTTGQPLPNAWRALLRLGGIAIPAL